MREEHGVDDPGPEPGMSEEQTEVLQGRRHMKPQGELHLVEVLLFPEGGDRHPQDGEQSDHQKGREACVNGELAGRPFPSRAHGAPYCFSRRRGRPARYLIRKGSTAAGAPPVMVTTSRSSWRMPTSGRRRQGYDSASTSAYCAFSRPMGNTKTSGRSERCATYWSWADSDAPAGT